MLNDLSAKINGKSSHISNDKTIADMLHVYAPKSENDTEAYIQQVTSTLGIPRTTQIKDLDSTSLAKAMIQVEDSTLYKHMFPN